MSGIIEALLAAVETRTIDMAECSEMYAGVTIPVRVNWTRAHKKKRWDLLRARAANYKASQGIEKGDDIEPFNKRGEEIAAEFAAWWGDALLMTQAEVETLRDNLPAPHWEWLLARIVKVVNEYEVAETKKVAGLRGRSSGEPEPTPPTSGKDSPQQDG